MTALHKAFTTLRVLAQLFAARNFGEYQHTLDGPNMASTAVYVWRGRVWHIPTGPVA